MLPLHRKYSNVHRLRRTRCTPLLLNTSEMTTSSPEEMDVRLSLGAVPYGYLPCRIMVASKQVAPRTTHFSLSLSLSLTTTTIRSSLILTQHTSSARGGSASLDVLTRRAHTYLSPQCKWRGVGGVGWVGAAMRGGARVVIWVKNCQEWGHVHEAFSVSLVGRRRSLVPWLVFLVKHSS